MTEEEWLTCEAPYRLLKFLRTPASARKLRLFGVACCRRISSMLTDERSRIAMDCAERFAEGSATQRERKEAYRMVRGYADEFAPDEAVLATLHRLPLFAAVEAPRWAAIAIGAATDSASSAPDHIEVGHRERDREIVRQAFLLREIFGNPFRPLACDPAWRTSTVVALAEGIYADRAFDRMPILADALQDAGCDSEDILAHCRDTQLTHVRGCWVIDLLTGWE